MTVYIDRRFRHIGRIKRSAGTAHKPTIKALDTMLTQLFNQGRLDVLREIQKGRYTLLEVYEFHRVNNIAGLPTAATMSQLEASMSAWIDDKECSEKHRASLHQSLRHLLSVSKSNPTVADLPELLALLRAKMKAAKHARSFNLVKAAAQAYVKSTLKRNHPLYFEVGAMEPLKVVQQVKKNPLTVADFAALIEKLSDDTAAIASTMACTGMGWTEYTGRWEDAPDRVTIHGTKRKGRNRIVPAVGLPTWVEMTYKRFREELAEASDNTVTPYDLRRTYANWLESAGIPRTRRKMYLGHGASDVTDLYERHEVERFLDDDAERLTAHIGLATGKTTLKLVSEA